MHKNDQIYEEDGFLLFRPGGWKHAESVEAWSGLGIHSDEGGSSLNTDGSFRTAMKEKGVPIGGVEMKNLGSSNGSNKKKCVECYIWSVKYNHEY